MDKKRDDKQILQTLEQLGINVQAERLKTEVHHLITLFEQGKTVEEALHTVSDVSLRNLLQPLVYFAALRALLLAATKLEVITPAQASDLTGYLLKKTPDGSPTHIQRL